MVVSDLMVLVFIASFPSSFLSMSIVLWLFTGPPLGRLSGKLDLQLHVC